MTSKEEEKKEKTFIAVRVVKKRGKGAVIEWVDKGRAFRKTVPLNKIKDGEIEESILDKAPDYGVPWAKELNPKASPEDIETALHNAGLWTSDDVLRNPGGVIGALNAAYKTDLATVLQVAKKHKNKE